MSAGKENPKSSDVPPSYEFWELNAQERGFYPSSETLKKLRELPAYTSVGIEFPQDLTEHTSLYGNKQTHISQRDVYYWNYLIAECQQMNLNVCYLDDINLHRQIVRLERIKSLTDHELNPMDIRQGWREPSDTRFWQLRRRSYNAETIAMAIKDVARAKVIHQNKKAYGVECSILTSNMIFANYVLDLQEMGYLNTDESSVHFNRIFDADYKPSDIDKASLNMRLLSRRASAIQMGRIRPTHQPNYIGVFQDHAFYTPEEGLFEIYLRDGIEIEGICSDVFGDAIIKGSVTDHSITFEKQYMNGRSLGEAKGTLSYEGIAENGIYRGQWNGHGRFLLIPYTLELSIKEMLDTSIDLNR